MQTVQLYIKNDSGVYERIEMFSDESVNVTESIKNAKDISKVFTTFTKQFSVPASKINNKIFKHYYNYSITGGFDARVKNDAKIEINSIPFKTGKIKLEGVDLRSNKPFAYRITFYGSVVDLKDILGEDKLPSLSALDIDKDYDSASVLSALTSAADSDGCLIPLITHSQRLYFDSARESEQSGNLYYGAKNQGVKFQQLKYAIRLDKIINAIETKYSSISFAADSFFKDATKDVAKLFMFCHRKKGEITIEAGAQTILTGFPVDTGRVADSDGTNITISENPATGDELVLTVTAANNDFLYDLLIYKNSTLFAEFKEISGTKVYNVFDQSMTNGDVFYAAVKPYEQNVSFSSMEWKYDLADNSQFDDDVYTKSTTTNIANTFVFNIANNLPEIKIIDFLSSLFKMFNLVAYVDDSNKIQVTPLDSFYTENEVDITKYVDVDKSQVNVALPYKEIFFKYEDTKTILAEQHFQEIADPPVEWGGVEYTNSESLSGETYNVKPSFHHAKYENLIDVGGSLGTTNIQVGYFVTDNEEAYLGKPLILYVNRVQPSQSIGFLSRNSRTQITTSTSINMPSNLEDFTDETSNNIHFNAENNEYNAQLAEETLFKRFYQKYIENIFDRNNRLIKVNTILPAGKLIQIELSDVIIIQGMKYRINSMSADLRTGRTEFELINYYVRS